MPASSKIHCEERDCEMVNSTSPRLYKDRQAPASSSSVQTTGEKTVKVPTNMITKSILLLTISAAVLSKPAPNPISVYQQDDGEEQQEYQQPIQQYRPAVQYKQQAAPRPRPVAYKQVPQGLQQQQQQSEDYEMEPPQPYQFQFDVNDDENTNYQNRKEQREGNKISGSYSVVDSDGFIRTVTYTADPVEGFKAHVSREPTNIVVKIPEPSQQPTLNSQYPAAAAPKAQYAQAARPAPVQYSGASLARPQAVPQTPRKQQTQQYLQGSQDPYAAFQPQGSVRVSQAIAQGGQVNQFLAESSPNSAQVNQFSNSNTALRG